MVRSKGFVDQVLWPEFAELDHALQAYLHEVRCASFARKSMPMPAKRRKFPKRCRRTDEVLRRSELLSNVFVWIGIAFCISQSAIFSGLNLAIFSISKLRLEVEAAGGNRDAVGLLTLRKDSNLTLATVLWGNVTINVLLTLLSDSVLAGLGAFAFSTIVITLFGEIIPQAYFSRNALRMAARLKPLLI